ncbi:MAG: transposase [Bacteroidaceae bacterium]|nr:transposase [Bacteroidaceae bacterium]
MKKLISLLVLSGVLAVYAFTKFSPEPESPKITFPVKEELQGRVIPIDLIQKRYTRINKNRVYKMSKEKFHRRRYDLLFKLSVLKDYYESGCSEYSISKKYDLKGTSSLRRWIETFPLDDKSLSLCEKLKEKIIQSRHMKEKARASKQLTEKEKLQEEILLLRKALQYSELRNEALNEMIRIAKEEDGYDVLKKRGAKQL